MQSMEFAFLALEPVCHPRRARIIPATLATHRQLFALGVRQSASCSSLLMCQRRSRKCCLDCLFASRRLPVSCRSASLRLSASHKRALRPLSIGRSGLIVTQGCSSRHSCCVASACAFSLMLLCVRVCPVVLTVLHGHSMVRTRDVIARVFDRERHHSTFPADKRRALALLLLPLSHIDFFFARRVDRDRALLIISSDNMLFSLRAVPLFMLAGRALAHIEMASPVSPAPLTRRFSPRSRMLGSHLCAPSTTQLRRLARSTTRCQHRSPTTVPTFLAKATCPTLTRPRLSLRSLPDLSSPSSWQARQLTVVVRRDIPS